MLAKPSPAARPVPGGLCPLQVASPSSQGRTRLREIDWALSPAVVTKESGNIARTVACSLSSWRLDREQSSWSGLPVRPRGDATDGDARSRIRRPRRPGHGWVRRGGRILLAFLSSSTPALGQNPELSIECMSASHCDSQRTPRTLTNKCQSGPPVRRVSRGAELCSGWEWPIAAGHGGPRPAPGRPKSRHKIVSGTRGRPVERTYQSPKTPHLSEGNAMRS